MFKLGEILVSLEPTPHFILPSVALTSQSKLLLNATLKHDLIQYQCLNYFRQIVISDSGF